jgi:hypothetical protein
VLVVPRLKMRVIHWHLPYNWGKSTEKPQSGMKNLSQVKKNLSHYKMHTQVKKNLSHYRIHKHISVHTRTHPPTHTHTHTQTHTHTPARTHTHPHAHTHTHTLKNNIKPPQYSRSLDHDGGGGEKTPCQFFYHKCLAFITRRGKTLRKYIINFFSSRTA